MSLRCMQGLSYSMCMGERVCFQQFPPSHSNLKVRVHVTLEDPSRGRGGGNSFLLACALPEVVWQEEEVWDSSKSLLRNVTI